MYDISPYDYKAESDGFVVVEISMPENTLGGVAVHMGFNNGIGWQDPFDAGWHRGPYPCRVRTGVPSLPAFHRVYTYPMRKGGLMHLRLMWESLPAHFGAWFSSYIINDRKGDDDNGGQGYSVIDLNVKVTFYPIGGYGKKEVAK